MKKLLNVIFALGTLLIPAASGLAQDADANANEAFLLVATPALNESNYRRTVILSLPIGGDRHLGIILNRPSRRTLAELFPEHEPSKKISEPVYVGGPMSQRAVFALVRGADNPGRGSLRVMDGLFLAMTENTVDRIIEEAPQRARFYVGDVIWRPGELREEVGDSFWHVMNVDPDILFRKDTQGLWDELTRLARAVRADAGQWGTMGAPRAISGLSPCPNFEVCLPRS
jgi:putative transcriptional regulator